MNSLTLNISQRFSKYPAGRYLADGPYSGEAFLSRQLLPLFEKCRQEGKRLVVELDGTAGYGSSFLEESFGGLVRGTKLLASEVLRTLEIASEDDSLIEEITTYMKEAEPQDRPNS